MLLALLLGALASSRGGAARTALQVDPAAEAQACALVLRTRPQRWGGRARGRIGELEWLARVAFHQVYGRWPVLSNPADLQRYGAILACTSRTRVL